MSSRAFLAAAAAVLVLVPLAVGRSVAHAGAKPAAFQFAENSSSSGSTQATGSVAFADIPSEALRTHFADVPSSTAVPTTFFGVHENLLRQTDSEADLAAQISRIRELNLGTLRFTISWNGLFDTGPIAYVTCLGNTPLRFWTGCSRGFRRGWPWRARFPAATIVHRSLPRRSGGVQGQSPIMLPRR